MGALLGGITAGPQAAKAVFGASRAMPGPASYPFPGSGYATATDACAQVDYTAERLAQARRILAGDFSTVPKNYPEYGPVDITETFRSISPSGRRFIQRAEHERQWKKRMIENAQQALEEYDKTGILRYFF